MSDRPEPMTVGRLRDILAAFDPDTPVMVSGYEGGFDYPSKLAVLDVCKHHSDDAWYFGRYDDRTPYDDEPVFKAVVIPR